MASGCSMVDCQKQEIWRDVRPIFLAGRRSHNPRAGETERMVMNRSEPTAPAIGHRTVAAWRSNRGRLCQAPWGTGLRYRSLRESVRAIDRCSSVASLANPMICQVRQEAMGKRAAIQSCLGRIVWLFRRSLKIGSSEADQDIEWISRGEAICDRPTPFAQPKIRKIV